MGECHKMQKYQSVLYYSNDYSNNSPSLWGLAFGLSMTDIFPSVIFHNSNSVSTVLLWSTAKCCINKVQRQETVGINNWKAQWFEWGSNLHSAVNLMFLLFCFGLNLQCTIRPCKYHGHRASGYQWELNEWSADANILCQPRSCLINLKMRWACEKITWSKKQK